jgi:hypothetical protein
LEARLAADGRRACALTMGEVGGCWWTWSMSGPVGRRGNISSAQRMYGSRHDAWMHLYPYKYGYIHTGMGILPCRRPCRHIVHPDLVGWTSYGETSCSEEWNRGTSCGETSYRVGQTDRQCMGRNLLLSYLSIVLCTYCRVLASLRQGKQGKLSM